jgi:3-oxoacyl-[acyl-carrier protein] reductase
MELGLRNRSCVITGGSRGIGRATALSLCAEGANVLLVGRSAEALDAVVAQCGERAASIALDVTESDAPERVLAACRERFGAVDVLVNNAGTSAVKPLEQLTDADWQDQWELHVMAPMRLMRTLGPAMTQRGWGRIVNVCSSSGKRPSKTNMAYSVTKAAQLSLSRAFADELAGSGVLVNAVTPGPVASELWTGEGGMADQVARAQGKTREQVLEDTAGRIPIGRMGTVEEIAAVITFLCSGASSNVTGAAWSVDGGAVPVII